MPRSFTEEVKRPVAQPDWLDEGLERAIKTFTLARAGKIPESIKGWMIKTACMRVLRAVYGDDVTTASEISASVLDKMDLN